MKLKLYTFDATKDQHLRELSNYYLRLIGRYHTVEWVRLKDRSQKRIEFDRVGSLFQKGHSIVLSERGVAVDTQALNRYFEELKNGGHGTVNFFVGNAFGFTPEVERRSDFCLSLSPLTMAHELAQVVLLEQLYRVFNLQAGGKYHNGV